MPISGIKPENIKYVLDAAEKICMMIVCLTSTEATGVRQEI